MNLKKLRRQAKPIRRLVTVGALITTLGATLTTHFLMGWEWRLALLFGTLVIVTGPTVITPLLRRLRAKHGVSTILEAEGIFIDAVGATVAVVVLNVVLSESAFGALGFVSKIGIGLGVGLAGGLVLALLFSRRRIIPEGLENIVALGIAVLTYQVSHAIEHESGITAAIIAGMVVSNVRSHAFEGLVEFKEQLVSLLIATLFVLLTADVRVADVVALGVPGLIVVGVLVFVVRPITVGVSTIGTDLTLREKAFLSWLAPRGIVAAAVASLFASELARYGVAGGVEMKALVFMVIAVTVTLQGLSGSVVARLLGQQRPRDLGYAILGANPLARAMARWFMQHGEPVVLIDSNLDACIQASKEGFQIVHGNGLEVRTMDLAMLDSRRATIGLTGIETVNFLFARKVRRTFKRSVAYVALETEEGGVTAEMVAKTDIRLIFGSEVHILLWEVAIRRNWVSFETWQVRGEAESRPSLLTTADERVLPMAVVRGSRITPVYVGTELKKGDQVCLAIRREHHEAVSEWLRGQGIVPLEASASAS